MAFAVLVRIPAFRDDYVAAGLVGLGNGRKTVCWAGGMDAMRRNNGCLDGNEPGWQEGWPEVCLLN